MARTKQSKPKKYDGKKPKAHLTKTASANERPVIRKKHKYRPGTVAVREIRRYQNSTDHLIARTQIERVIRECAGNSMRFAPDAIKAIHEAAEYYIIKVLELANDNAIHANRVTLQVKDLHKVVKSKDRMKHD